MTDTEFKELKEELERKMIEVEALQDAYEEETGVRFVRPVRLSYDPFFVTQYEGRS